MRHQKAGRHLNRTPAHRRALFRNLSCSLILSLKEYEPDEVGKPKVAGRITTTLAKAKELRPIFEKLITLAKKSQAHEDAAEQFATSAARHTSEWKAWRESPRWQEWNQAIAPAVSLRRRAFAALRDKEAVRILFADLAPRFRDRNGGYLRVVRLPTYRLGDGGVQAMVEFVGQNDRVKTRRRVAPVVTDDQAGG
jgi:large subunit ribosomal protein L17